MEKYITKLLALALLTMICFIPIKSPKIGIEKRTKTEIEEFLGSNFQEVDILQKADLYTIIAYNYNIDQKMVEALEQDYQLNEKPERLLMYKELMEINGIKNDELEDLLNESIKLFYDSKNIFSICIKNKFTRNELDKYIEKLEERTEKILQKSNEINL